MKKQSLNRKFETTVYYLQKLPPYKFGSYIVKENTYHPVDALETAMAYHRESEPENRIYRDTDIRMVVVMELQSKVIWVYRPFHYYAEPGKRTKFKKIYGPYYSAWKTSILNET